MYRTFQTIEDLREALVEDKNCRGADSGMQNRYPIRFVLLNNFEDFKHFVEERPRNIKLQPIDNWLPEGYSDLRLTYTELATKIKNLIKYKDAETGRELDQDTFIVPFSEMTRFYKEEDFNALVKVIRLIEASDAAQADNRRYYIPIVGMQNKMSHFHNDINIHIYEYLSENDSNNYHLILTNGTDYGVKGLEDLYAVCRNYREWVTLWSKEGSVKKQIICTSANVYNNAENTKPDNAFVYTRCDNAYSFLSIGLELDFGNIPFAEEDMHYWEQLAQEIDVREDFDFENYVLEKFNVQSLSGVQGFVSKWCEHTSAYDHWLLKNYYLTQSNETSYLHRILKHQQAQTFAELFGAIALRIFSEEYNIATLQQRQEALAVAQDEHLTLREEDEEQLGRQLQAMAAEISYERAMLYITPLTATERNLMVQWYGEGKIARQQLQKCYPELYYYTAKQPLSLETSVHWIADYFAAYREAKVAGSLTTKVESILNEHNKGTVTFEAWHSQFKTVKTLLHNRSDIEQYYWIDGLGVDWIPYITYLIGQHKANKVYLNEIHIATALLPTTTEINKPQLEDLNGGKLEKSGDLDTYAHEQKQYPDYISEEFQLLQKAIQEIIAKFNGKKVAIVSDHGLSYLAGHAEGLNLAGITPHHSGRYGEWETTKPTNDDKYTLLTDSKRLCTLTHHSLVNKVYEGKGAHGGATPEEVLVPIFILSSQENTTHVTARLLTKEVVANNAVVRYEIKGNLIETPTVHYNNKSYSLRNVVDNIFESEALDLTNDATQVNLTIGSFVQKETIVVKTGAVEEDLFGDL